MKSTLLQVLFVFVSYSEFISAVRYYDPLEDYLMQAREREEEYRRQQEELRIRFEQQQEEQRRRFLEEDTTELGSGLLPTAIETSTIVFDDESTSGMTTTTTTPATTSQDDSMTTARSSRHHEMRHTCCRLGDKASRSGFLCTPENYRPQLIMRQDLYRQSNFKISRTQREQYVEMRQFTKCISGAVPSLSEEFQRCCKQAYVEQVLGVSSEDESDRPIMLELPLQIDIISKQRKHPRTHHKSHVKV